MEYDEFMNMYDELHKCCPKCGEIGNYSTTLKAYIYDESNPNEYRDLNKCVCQKCGNKHTCHERIPLKNNNLNNE